MKIITVVGWYGKGNCGDESYKLAFPKVFNGVSFRFTGKLTHQDIKESDAFILGGGDVLSPYFLNQFSKIKKPKSIISVSANEKVDPKLLEGFKNIIVRDSRSLNILTKKGVKAAYAPDIAFSLSGDSNHGKQLIREEFIKQERDLYQKVVAVVINGFLSEDHANSFDSRTMLNFHQVAYKLAHVMDYTNASFIFVPFGQEPPWDDRVTNMWVGSKAKFWKKNLSIYSEPNVQNVLDIIAASDAIISTRLHSTIFAMATKTPIIDITHNHKNRWLLETVDKMKFSLNYRSLDEEILLSKLNDLIHNRDIHIKSLSALLEKQKTLLKGISNVCIV